MVSVLPLRASLVLEGVLDGLLQLWCVDLPQFEGVVHAAGEDAGTLEVEVLSVEHLHVTSKPLYFPLSSVYSLIPCGERVVGSVVNSQ